MADPNDNLRPMNDGDVAAAHGNNLQSATPRKTAGDSAETGRFQETRQTLKDNAQKLTQQAGDKARVYAEDGKARAGGALDQVSQLLTDAAGTVDEKLGEQYGQYARSAAEQVQGFSNQLKDKSIDDLVDDVRALVRKSPAVAIGTAAALGFVVARLLTAGFDQHDRA